MPDTIAIGFSRSCTSTRSKGKDDEGKTMNGEILIYESGNHTIEVRLDGGRETLWLSLQQMADLLDRDKSVISRHLRNVFKVEELSRDSVVAKNATTAADGKTYQVDYYNLDAIISVGYRVNSKKGTQFRIWATQRLKEYLVQGYAINQQRFDKNSAELKQAIALIQKGRSLQR